MRAALAGNGLQELRGAIRDQVHAEEPRCVRELMLEGRKHLSEGQRRAALERSRKLVERCRAAGRSAGTLDAFMQEFGLSNSEGVALMCLAEALLRIPDGATIDKLIAEKVRAGDWKSHLGKSGSLFVNASVWGLMLTGRMTGAESEALSGDSAFFRRLAARLGEPLVRRAVLQAMRILGLQYVLGRTIGEALQRARRLEGGEVRFSFDMLGEGARTLADAERHYRAYAEAIEAIGAAEGAACPTEANGISIKLSALHPRFEYAQRRRLQTELAPKLKALAQQAKAHGLGLSLDAEEAARLELSMDLFEQLAVDPDLEGWNGLGFVLQAYQKRAPLVADWLIALARQTNRRFMVRLVKGAYWDAEIKHAQEQGFVDYPVFSRKAGTDLCYEVCAARLLAARDAVYPQFASHNAYTLAIVEELAASSRTSRSATAKEAQGRVAAGRAQALGWSGNDAVPTAKERAAHREAVSDCSVDDGFELQRLHGMGELLYAQFRKTSRRPLRIYAPVGAHADLLPYLVRRLLENGANSSFVNRFLDNELAVDELLQDPLSILGALEDVRHPKIPPPPLHLPLAENRRSARGLDLDDPNGEARLTAAIGGAPSRAHRAGPIIGGQMRGAPGAPVPSPADRSMEVGSVVDASAADVDRALSLAVAGQPGWNAFGADARASILNKAAELLESRYEALIGLIAFEAGRTLADGLAELREAVDFCRYYAEQARRRFGAPIGLPGPTGELNELSLDGRGVFLCISPWNFPLAIFMGQVAAALAAGNAVVAKPAEQTPLIAAEAVRLLHEAGVPGDVLHLLPGDGEAVGGALVKDPRVAGVAFTGSYQTAKSIERSVAARSGPIVPIIAETGGQNAMLVDSTALAEQVVDDVVASAFKSAGQRCSALRILCLQDEVADDVLLMLKGAMEVLSIGEPWLPATDIGPVIDEAARSMLESHRSSMLGKARLIAQCSLPPACGRGTFFAPCVFAIDDVKCLEQEVFGPVLHVVRFNVRDLRALLDDINATGYGLTLGVHSRSDSFVKEVFENTQAGNVYVNRNMVGAVVGVNPFGGRGLSGTGPKAGGPHYLPRFAVERTRTENLVAKGGNAELFSLMEH